MEIYVKLEETAFLFKCLLCMDLEGYKHLDKDSNDLPSVHHERNQLDVEKKGRMTGP